jgi:hypothetical protein
MNDDVLNDLTAHVAQAVEALPASRTRRQHMQEELLAHLLDLYDEELAQIRDERAAADRAKQRFGRPDDLRSDLATAVPMVERLILLTCGKGNVMWRWLWIMGVLAVMVGMGFVLPAAAKLRNPDPIMPGDRFGVGVLLPFGVVVTLLGLGFFGYSLLRVFRARSF